jgi:hypothetical protein
VEHDHRPGKQIAGKGFQELPGRKLEIGSSHIGPKGEHLALAPGLPGHLLIKEPPRRPEEAGPSPRQLKKDPGGSGDLLPQLAGVEIRQGVVGIAVALHLMAPAGRLRHQLRVLFRRFPGKEKGGPHPFPIQQFQKRRVEFGSGTVVEGEGHSGRGGFRRPER